MKKFIYLICSLAFLASCTTVHSDEVGIKFHKFSAKSGQQGGVEGTVNGWVCFNPITKSVFKYKTTVQRKNYEPFTVNAKDASVFTMDPQIAYRLNKEKACDVFVKYRKPLKELEDGYIRTCIYEAYRTCANKYSSDSLMSNRAQFENDVRNRLEISLAQEGFIVEEFTSAITPPQSLVDMIDAKNRAVQESLKAINEVKKAEAEAQIAIAEAKGKAEALRIEADGESYYNAKIAASLTDNLIKQDMIEKWDGKLPTYVGGTNPFLMLNK